MGQICSNLLQNRGKIQGKLFQNRGKWRIFCTKKGASAPLSLHYISVILYQNQFTCLSVQLHPCYFISVLLYISITLYRHYFI